MKSTTTVKSAAATAAAAAAATARKGIIGDQGCGEQTDCCNSSENMTHHDMTTLFLHCSMHGGCGAPGAAT